MRVLVMGAGAMGSVVGGLLAHAGHSVTLVGRAPHMTAIHHHGLHITGIWGQHHVRTLRATTALDGLVAGAFDLVLITVKSYDTAAAVAEIAPLVGDDALVCAYQNGLGNAEKIAAQVGWRRTVGARAIFGAVIREPGQVDVTVIAQPTALGVFDEATPADRVRQIVAAMDEAGIPTVYTEKIATVLWSKVAYNCALNALSGLLDVPYGVLPDTEAARAIMAEIVGELYAVAGTMGIALEPATPGEYMDLLYHVLIPPTAAHYASTREDFRLRRPTEIDALNGAIVAYGKQHGVPTPVNALITRLVHAREHALAVDLAARFPRT
jgi:2-dehydropantoate 2-reductase